MSGLIWIYTVFWKILCFVYNHFYPIQATGGKMVSPEFFSPRHTFACIFLCQSLSSRGHITIYSGSWYLVSWSSAVSIWLVCSCVSSLRQQIQIRMRSMELPCNSPHFIQWDYSASETETKLLKFGFKSLSSPLILFCTPANFVVLIFKRLALSKEK